MPPALRERFERMALDQIRRDDARKQDVVGDTRLRPSQPKGGR